MFSQSLWALAAAALFSLMATFIKMSAGHFGTFELVFYRSLFGVFFIASYVWMHGLTLKTVHVFGHIKRSVLGTLSVAVWFFSLGLLPLSTNITLTYTTPLFMAVNIIVLAFLRHKKAPWTLSVAIVAGFMGVLITLQPSFGKETLLPGLLCLSVALIDLVTYWQIKELGEMHEPSWRIVFYFTVFGTVFGLIGTLLTTGFHAITTESGLLLAGIGVCATLAQLCTTRSYASGNMLLSSCLGFSSIPFSAVLSCLFFSDSISLTMACGMGLIVAAGILATVSVKRREAQERREKENAASAQSR